MYENFESPTTVSELCTAAAALVENSRNGIVLVEPEVRCLLHQAAPAPGNNQYQVPGSVFLASMGCCLVQTPRHLSSITRGVPDLVCTLAAFLGNQR